MCSQHTVVLTTLGAVLYYTVATQMCICGLHGASAMLKCKIKVQLLLLV